MRRLGRLLFGSKAYISQHALRIHDAQSGVMCQDAASSVYYSTLKSGKHVYICSLNHPQCHLVAFVELAVLL